VFHWDTFDEDGFQLFVPELRARAPALVELRVLASVRAGPRTTVHWQRLLTSVAHARHADAWPETIAVEVATTHKTQLLLHRALALAEQEAHQKPELAALKDIPGIPRLMVVACEAGSDYTIERLLA
jgi:hypothetical protein